MALSLVAPAMAASTTTTTDPLREQLADKQSTLRVAKNRLSRLQAELDLLAEQHNKVEVHLALLEDEVAFIEKEITRSEADLAEVRLRLEERLVELYKHNSGALLPYVEILVDGEDLTSVLDQFEALSKIVEQDRKLFEEVRVHLEASRSSRRALVEKQAERAAEAERLGRLEEEASAKCAAANAEYNSLKRQVATLKEEIRKADAAAAAAAEAARKRAIQQKAYREGQYWNNSSNGTMQAPPFVFPVKGAHSFIDSWGYPRSGGRTHKGCDVMAAEGTPLVACVTGTISGVNRTDTGLGGITVHLKGENGYVYYYAHLSRIATGIDVGLAVKAGRTIGYVGHTGNAGTCNHLHFGMRPGGGSSVNPYATLRFYDD